MIRDTRERRKIPMVRMARDLGTSAAALSRYETGQREWPAELYARALAYLKLESDQPQEYWDWRKHRAFWDSYTVETDPGSTWAEAADAYADFYREMDRSKLPPVDFRRRVRIDSLLEPCIYASWCIAGAECVYVSLVAMSFPYHPLVTENLKPMPMDRRAAFYIDGWIFWAQVNLLVKGKKVRVDCLGFDGLRWVVLEWHGPLHSRNPEQQQWDKKREELLGMEVHSFTQAEILSGHIVDLIRQRLGPARGRKAS